MKTIMVTQCSEVFSDCTSRYTVNINKSPMTVEDFIATVIEENPDEWGYIGIKNGNAIFGDPHMEYKWGKYDSSPMESVKNAIVKRAKAEGGWSRMDYLLEI